MSTGEQFISSKRKKSNMVRKSNRTFDPSSLSLCIKSSYLYRSRENTFDFRGDTEFPRAKTRDYTRQRRRRRRWCPTLASTSSRSETGLSRSIVRIAIRFYQWKRLMQLLRRIESVTEGPPHRNRPVARLLGSLICVEKKHFLLRVVTRYITPILRDAYVTPSPAASTCENDMHQA